MTIRFRTGSRSTTKVFSGYSVTDNLGSYGYADYYSLTNYLISSVKIKASCGDGWYGNISISRKKNGAFEGRYYCKYNGYERYHVDGDSSNWDEINGAENGDELTLDCDFV